MEIVYGFIICNGENELLSGEGGWFPKTLATGYVHSELPDTSGWSLQRRQHQPTHCYRAEYHPWADTLIIGGRLPWPPPKPPLRILFHESSLPMTVPPPHADVIIFFADDGSRLEISCKKPELASILRQHLQETKPREKLPTFRFEGSLAEAVDFLNDI